MKFLTGKTFAVTLIAGLLVLANVENRAEELDSYLDNAMRMQVFEELKENMQRLYEGKVITPATSREDNNLQVKGVGFPVANRGGALRNTHRIGIVN